MSVLETERPLTGLRLVPAPISEPPYDDERPGGQPLPLRPASFRTAPPLRLVPTDDVGQPAQTTDDLPPVKPYAHALVQRLLEVLGGVRPLAQLQRDLTLDVYDGLEHLVTSRPRATGRRPDGRSIRSVHVQQQPDAVAEVFATVRRGQRYAALALRLEGAGDRWRCTDLICP